MRHVWDQVLAFWEAYFAYKLRVWLSRRTPISANKLGAVTSFNFGLEPTASCYNNQQLKLRCLCFCIYTGDTLIGVLASSIEKYYWAETSPAEASARLAIAASLAERLGTYGSVPLES